MVSPLLYPAMILVATGIIWKGSAYLEHASEVLAKYYGLPPVVQGAIVVAIGSSFPELSSAVISTLLHGEFDLGVGAIVGSAIFNILVIPALATLYGGAMDSDRNVVYKEAQFYMISVAVLLLTFSFAIIYNPSATDRLVGTVTRPLAVLPMLLYGLYVFIQYMDTKDAAQDRVTDVNVLKQWAVLGGSLFAILIGVELMVKAAIGLGELFNTPSFLWGLTVIAAGTSLPDALVSIRSSQAEKDVTSLANVLGSNIFDLLVAVPSGILIAGAATVHYGMAVPMMGVLTFATILLFGMMRTELELNRTEAYVLLTVYVLFIAWVLAETMDLVNMLPAA